MAHRYEPFVRETSLSETTDDFELEGAMFSSIPFATILATGDTCDYVAQYGAAREEGVGTMLANGKLERTTITRALHANGTVNTTKVSFAPGEKTINMVAAAWRHGLLALWDGSVLSVATAGAHNGSVGAGTPSTGAFTTVTASTGFSGPLNGTVGAGTPSTGAFTTLSFGTSFSFTGGTHSFGYSAGSLGFITASSHSILINRTGSNGEVAIFQKAGSTVGSIIVEPSGTTFFSISDRKAKIRERRFKRAGAIIDRLILWDHGWRDQPGKRSLSLFAQQAHRVWPNPVTKPRRRGDPWLISYILYVPLLIGALRETRADLAEQKKLVAKLLKRVTALERRAKK
jgi:hypothetical protein